MKDLYEVLQQKESDLARVRHEIASLRIAASILSDDLSSGEPTKKREISAEKTLNRSSESEATGTDGLFSSVSVSRAGFWKALRRKK